MQILQQINLAVLVAGFVFVVRELRLLTWSVEATAKSQMISVEALVAFKDKLDDVLRLLHAMERQRETYKEQGGDMGYLEYMATALKTHIEILEIRAGKEMLKPEVQEAFAELRGVHDRMVREVEFRKANPPETKGL